MINKKDIENGKAGFILTTKNKGDQINTAGIYYAINEERPQYFEYIWADPNIFTDEARDYFMTLPEGEKPKFLVELLEQFYRNNKEYANFARVQIYQEPMLLLDFFRAINESDFEKCGVSISSKEYGDRFKRLQELINEAEKAIEKTPIDPNKLTTIWPILTIRELFTETELAAFYYLQANKNKGIQLKKGREQRQELKAKAEQQGAIMNLRGGNFDFFSDSELWDAYGPAKIFKIGSLDPAFIDAETGAITKSNLTIGEEIEPLTAPDVSLKALTLLTAIMKNSVNNIRESFVKGDQITFYVKGVLEKITDDTRMITDTQLNLDRKTAGVLYLENLFAPMQGYIGQLPNGSRWSIFNYIGYDAESDTMTIQAPYIYQLWKREQAEYFETVKVREKLIEQGKRTTKRDYTPLKVNSYFKNRAYSENEITLEIAVYITNRILQAGGAKGQTKKTELLFSELIKKCPRLNDAWQNIDSRTNTTNKTALYNAELRKIKRAIDIIQDPEKCDFLNEYDFIEIKPAKVNKKTGRAELIPPTKKKLENKLTIVWSRKIDADLI